MIPWLLGEIPSTSARCASRIESPWLSAICKLSATRSSTSMLRATKSSVAGTDSRSASRTALRPATISPRGASPFENLRVVAGFLAADFSAAFLRFAAA